MTADNPNRQPAGVPTGGQFASENRGRASVDLDPRDVAEDAYLDDGGYGADSDVPGNFDEPEREPHCFACGRHTEHVGEHDWLNEAGLVTYDGPVVLRTEKWDDERAAAISRAEYDDYVTRLESGADYDPGASRTICPDAIGNAGEQADCAHCKTTVTSDGAGSWVDAADGDGCDNPDGVHQSRNTAANRLAERYAMAEFDTDALAETVRRSADEDPDGAADADMIAEQANSGGRLNQIRHLVNVYGPAVAADELSYVTVTP